MWYGHDQSWREKDELTLFKRQMRVCALATRRRLQNALSTLIGYRAPSTNARIVNGILANLS